MSDMQIETIVDEKALVGEGPVWDPNNSVLYWTDIRGGRYFKYDPATNVTRRSTMASSSVARLSTRTAV